VISQRVQRDFVHQKWRETWNCRDADFGVEQRGRDGRVAILQRRRLLFERVEEPISMRIR